MHIHADKKHHADTRSDNVGSGSRQALADASPKIAQLRAMQAMADAAPRTNATGLPDRLKSGVEALSGVSLDGVKVHYNSTRPAQLHAHAYAQGSDIHVAPGQERHLPHEAWHLVQQAQGRVRPTMQMHGGTLVNDDQSLEREADTMGDKALQMVRVPATPLGMAMPGASVGIVQRVTKEVAGTTVSTTENGGYPQWDMAGYTWHINFNTDPFHVTREGSPKEHYFYKRAANGTIKDAVSGQKDKKKFSQLPKDVQNFIRDNYDSL